MKNRAPIQSNSNADPGYPYHSEWSDDGEIIYDVPIRSDGDEAHLILNGVRRVVRYGGKVVDELEMVRVKGNQALAYYQKKVVTTERRTEARYAERIHYFEGDMMNGKPVSRDEHPLMSVGDQNIEDFPAADAFDRIFRIIQEKHPDNPNYAWVWEKDYNRTKPKQIARELSLPETTVRHMIRANRIVAKAYFDMYYRD